jgi:nucleoside-triphosphatase THEP1
MIAIGAAFRGVVDDARAVPLVGFIRNPPDGSADRVLRTVAETLLARGFRVRGVVCDHEPAADDHACDTALRLLPCGPVISISQKLGRNARGCRLDSDAFERVSAAVASGLADGADVLVLNKFGKREAEGGGLRQAIAGAVSAGVPVVIGVSERNHDSLLRFVAELGVELPARAQVICHWAAQFGRAPKFAPGQGRTPLVARQSTIL